MTDNAAPMGHNSGDLAAEIEAAYSPLRLAADHDALALDVQGMAEHAGRLVEVKDHETSTQAAQVVVALRELIKRVDDTHDAVKEPVFKAGKNVDAFFNTLNNSDTKKPGPLTRHKLRIENLIRDHAFRVAEEERKRVAEAARVERERLEAEAAAAAAAEAEGRAALADTLQEAALKTEQVAEKLEQRAEGPVQDLARQRTESGVVGLRGMPDFEITDLSGLLASLGPLGEFIAIADVTKAIRAFQAHAIKMGRAVNADEITGYKRKQTITPALPGVEFFVRYQGSVRA